MWALVVRNHSSAINPPAGPQPTITVFHQLATMPIQHQHIPTGFQQGPVNSHYLLTLTPPPTTVESWPHHLSVREWSWVSKKTDVHLIPFLTEDFVMTDLTYNGLGLIRYVWYILLPCQPVNNFPLTYSYLGCLSFLLPNVLSSYK